MPGRPTREFHEYLTTCTASHVSHDDYVISPGTAFLKYMVEAKNAVDMCVRNFPKNQRDTYTKNSLDSLQYVVTSALPSIMGHFETYERYLFSGVFDFSRFLHAFSVDSFFRNISKDRDIAIDLRSLAAYRGYGASSIGKLLADSLSGWHDPARVNAYFRAFGLTFDLFSNSDKDRLCTLWQLRHSIVHSGGTLTLPDAQKVDALTPFGDRQIAFENNFVFEVCRKLHPLIKRATEGIGSAFKNKLSPRVPDDDLDNIDAFFKVRSSVTAWL